VGLRVGLDATEKGKYSTLAGNRSLVCNLVEGRKGGGGKRRGRDVRRREGMTEDKKGKEEERKKNEQEKSKGQKLEKVNMNKARKRGKII
jgi:hypothetical protein